MHLIAKKKNHTANESLFYNVQSDVIFSYTGCDPEQIHVPGYQETWRPNMAASVKVEPLFLQIEILIII